MESARIPLLDVRDLVVEFATRRGPVQAVRQVNLSVAKGETVGIVGESGSGKSVTSYAVMHILDRAGRVADGSIVFSGIDMVEAGFKTRQAPTKANVVAGPLLGVLEQHRLDPFL